MFVAVRSLLPQFQSTVYYKVGVCFAFVLRVWELAFLKFWSLFGVGYFLGEEGCFFFLIYNCARKCKFWKKFTFERAELSREGI